MSNLTNKYLDQNGLKILVEKIANMYDTLQNNSSSDSEESSSGITWTVIE